MSHFKLSKLFPRLFSSEKHRDDNYHGDKGKYPQLKVVFLDDTELAIPMKLSSKGQILLDKTADHLNLLEKDYFGLRFIDSTNQAYWVDPNKSLTSQLKHTNPPYVFYFGVKFYAPDPCKLQEEITRYQYFLQVRRDILQGRLPITFDDAAELCAYSLQSELGDYDHRRHSPGYISEIHFVPNQSEELESRIASIHRRLSGHVPSIAEYKYLDKVKWMDMYGVDLHPVKGELNTEYFLGLAPIGIIVYKNKTKVGNYYWPRITKVTFKGKVFMVKVKDKHNDQHTYAFELLTKAACKQLWKCCVEHHAFFRLNQVTAPSTKPGKFFSLGSKHRFSARSERQSFNEGYGRTQPNVLRVPSRRQQRRAYSDTGLNSNLNSSFEGAYTPSQGGITVIDNSGSRMLGRHYSDVQGSPKSTHSAPWVTHRDGGGLYTSGRDSPLSMRSEKMKFPTYGNRRPASGSESEGGQRRRYLKKGSDNESDVSVPRRRWREAESGSESETSNRRYAKHRRPKSTGGETTDYRNGYHTLPGTDNQINGSIPSMHSAAATEAHNRRKQRRRSKSPNSRRPPEELRQHIQYDLKDPNGLSQEQLQDIPYTKVETKAEPFRMKHRHWQRKQSQGEVYNSNGRLVAPPGEAPPPYTTAGSLSRSHEPQRQQSFTNNNNYSRQNENYDNRPSPSAYRHQPPNGPIMRNEVKATVFSAFAPDNPPNPYQLLDQSKGYTHVDKPSDPLNSASIAHSREDSGLGNEHEYNVDSIKSNASAASHCHNKADSIQWNNGSRTDKHKQDQRLNNTRSGVSAVEDCRVINQKNHIPQTSSNAKEPSIAQQTPSNPRVAQTSSSASKDASLNKGRQPKILNCSVDSEIMKHVLLSPGFNRNLCTEL